MEMHIGRKSVPVAIALAIVAMAARSLWPSDARDIRRRLEALAEIASVPESETDLERLARLARLGRFFSEDVILRKDVSSFVGGRQAVVGLALQGAAAYGRMTVAFDDVQVAVTDATTATAYMTLKVSGGSPQASALEPRQVSVTLSKIKGEWLVSRGEVLRTLEPTQ
jgi:hypothetical protein